MLYEYAGVVYPSRSMMCAARREHYVELLRQGLNFTQAAKAVGVSKRTGKVWRNGRTRSSGRNEKASVAWYCAKMEIPENAGPYYLGLQERIIIADRLHAGKSIRAIAAELGRAPSTISREINKHRSPLTGDYQPYHADQQVAQARKRPKPAKINRSALLFQLVEDGLKKHWSPEQISGWLKKKYPDNPAMNMCVETIYQAIYVHARGQLKLEVKKMLRTGRVRRKPHKQPQQRTPRFKDPMTMIADRPAQVDERIVPGHWEGDLICGAGNKSAIGTLVERKTRFTILLYLPNHHDAGSVQEAIVKKMQGLPKLLRNSLTWDQGSEMALHKKITTSLDMDVFFCDPHSPWQRGTNENTNGLLRQYFPKATDLSQYPEEYLDAVAEELNDRPRKTLEYDKPSERILKLLA